MNALLENLRRSELWTISVQLLVLYIVSVALFFGLYEVWLKLAGPQKGAVAAGRPGPTALIFVLEGALNLAGVAAFAWLARRLGEAPRLAMIGVPLVLILEKHVRRLREAPGERRVQLLGAAGAAAGVLSGVFFFMRHAPLK